MRSVSYGELDEDTLMPRMWEIHPDGTFVTRGFRRALIGTWRMDSQVLVIVVERQTMRFHAHLEGETLRLERASSEQPIEQWVGQRQPAERYPPMRTDRSAPLPTFDLATDGTPSAIGRLPARFF
jgi:hypothetical protein